MLDQALEVFDEKFYTAWKKRADDLLILLEQSLDKLNFQQDVAEIIRIKELILLAKQATDKATFVKSIKEINNQINQLALKKDFKNTTANNIIFHSKRAVNHIAGAFLTEHLDFAQAVLNPSGKAQKRSPEGMQGKIVKKAAQEISKQILQVLDQNANVFLGVIAQQTAPVTVTTIVDKSKEPPYISPLASLIGNERAQALKSTIKVDSPESAVAYLDEQIYGNAFEFYYLHVAKLCDMFSNPSLLKQNKLMDLQSEQSIAFLNKIAVQLGFENSLDLLNNYKQIHEDASFNRLKEIKARFMEIALQKDLLKEQDPLEQIIQTLQNEHKRVLEKVRLDKKYSKNNMGYETILCYAAVDYPGAIQMQQRKKNVAGIVAEKYLAALPTSGFAGWAVGKGIEVLQSTIESSFLSSLLVDQHFYERRLHDLTSTAEDLVENLMLKKEDELELHREAFYKNTEEELKQFNTYDLIVFIETQQKKYTALEKEQTKGSAELDSLIKKNNEINLNLKKRNSAFSVKFLRFFGAEPKDVKQLQKEKEKVQRELKLQSKYVTTLSRRFQIHQDLINIAKNYEKTDIDNLLIKLDRVLVEKDFLETLNKLMMEIEAHPEYALKVFYKMNYYKEKIKNNNFANLEESIQKLNSLILEKNDLVAKTKAENILSKLMPTDDPFLMLENEAKDLLEVLSENSKNTLYDFIHQQFINNVKGTRKELEDLYLKIARRYHAEKGKVKKYYANCLQAVKQKIENEFDKYVNQESDPLRLTIEDLDHDYLHLLEKLVMQKAKHQGIVSSYQSNVYNLFGLMISKEAVAESEFDLATMQDELDLFSKSYVKILSAFLQRAAEYYPKLSIQVLQEHVERLESNIIALQAIDSDLVKETLAVYEQLLETAREYKKQHVSSDLDRLNQAINRMSLKLNKINSLAEKINQSVAATYQFDQAQHNRLLLKISKLEAILKNLPTLIAAVDEKLENWSEKNEIQFKLMSTQRMLEKIKGENIAIFEFYSKIKTGEKVENIHALKDYHLGKGLILAIIHNNNAIIEQILSQPHAINMQDLGLALREAAKRSDIALMEKLLQYRSDLPFTNDDIYQALKSAIENQKMSAVRYLILNGNPVVDSQFLKLITTQEPTHTRISPIKRGFTQLVVDADGAALENIRKCYAFLSQISETPLSEPQRAKIAKLKQKMIAFYEQSINNQTRKEEQLEIWDNDLEPDAVISPPVLTQFKPQPISGREVSLKEKEKQLVQVIELGSGSATSLLSLINELNHVTETAAFSKTMASATLLAVQKSRNDYLELILMQLEHSSQKQEIVFTALREALDTGNHPALTLLLNHRAFLGREKELIQTLKEAYARSHKEEQVLDCLMHFTPAMDEDMNKLIQNVAYSQRGTSQVSSVAKGWWDNDFEHLNDVRLIYVFQKMCFSKLENDLLVNFRQPLMDLSAEKLPKDLTESEINQIERNIAYLKANHEYENKNILTIRDLNIKHIRQHYAFENESRFEKHNSEWKNQIKEISDRYNKTFQQDMGYAQKIVDEYRLEHPPVKKAFSATQALEQQRRATRSTPPR